MSETAAARGALNIEGELTIYTAAETTERITAALAADSALDIDLSQVGEIDSAGLQLLIMAQRAAKALGRDVALVNHSTAVRECLELCNMTAALGDKSAPAAQE